MERPKMPGEMLAAIKTRPQSEVRAYFEQLILWTCSRLQACKNDDERRELQAEAKSLADFKESLLSEMSRK